MKIFKTSYYNKEIEKEMTALAGKSYSFLDRIKMKGIGSKRLKVFEASETVRIAMNASHYMTLVSLEIRPKALMVYFRKKIDNYTCIFPYESLAVEKVEELIEREKESELVRLVCGEEYILLENDFDFFSKLQSLHY